MSGVDIIDAEQVVGKRSDGEGDAKDNENTRDPDRLEAESNRADPEAWESAVRATRVWASKRVNEFSEGSCRGAGGKAGG